MDSCGTAARAPTAPGPAEPCPADKRIGCSTLTTGGQVVLGCFHTVVDPDETIHRGQLQHGEHDWSAGSNADAPAALLQLLVQPHDHADRGGVDELHAGEVEHDGVGAVIHGLLQTHAHIGDRGQVKDTAHLHDKIP